LRILWLKTELLHPVDKGGKIRTYHMLKELKRDHHVTYLTLDDGSAPPSAAAQASEYCHELIRIPHRTTAKFSAAFYSELASNLLSSMPYAIKKYVSAGMRDALLKQVQQGGFDVVVCDFLAPAGNVPANLSCPTVLFQHNVEAMIWRRHFEVQSNAAKKTYLRGQWRKMQKFEAEMCRQFDAVVAVSVEDRDTMIREYDAKNVYDIPTGVDVDFFRPSGTVAVQPNNLVFTGSMDWLPNEDGIRYFTEEIMPLVRREVPDVTLTVVGRDPYPALLELSKKDSSIVVTGRVDDVRPYMEKACGYIVPLRIGGGTRLKIYEAMAMEKAVVSTTIGAEGLPVKNGEELILADTNEDFANAIVKVLREPDFANRLGKHAASTVREKFGWRKVAEEFAAICERSVVANSKLP
jgi:sugar transferase (PEP-CTERM/EpsH1 system associated)